MPLQAGPELSAAIIRVAIVEGVAFALATVLYFVFNTIWGFVGAALLGSAMFIYTFWQLGMFGGRNE